MPGVLPFTVINNETYFLLGKERGGKDKDTWCMFSGGREVKDLSDKLAAAREAHEESAGLLGTIDEIASRVIPLNGSQQSFLLEVKDPGDITNKKFIDARSKYTDPHYREMTQVKWVKASQLVDACVKNKGIFTVDGKQEQVRPFVSKILKENADYLKSGVYITKDVKPIINNSPKPIINNSPKKDNKFNAIQIDSIAKINFKNFNKDTLVLFDLDETLLIDKNHKRQNIDVKHIGNKQYIPIENNVGGMIETIKKINADKTVLGLTKRGYIKERSGDSQAKELNIPFSRRRFEKLNMEKIGNKGCFNNGVIYTAGGDKGMHLGDFLKKAGINPKEIVMVDDRLDNLEAVHKFALSLNIPVTTYQMTGADKFNLAAK